MDEAVNHNFQGQIGTKYSRNPQIFFTQGHKQPNNRRKRVLPIDMDVDEDLLAMSRKVPIYEYTSLNNLIVRSEPYHMYGVITKIVKELQFARYKWHTIVVIVDESLIDDSNGIFLHIFGEQQSHFPKIDVGIVLRAHRVKTEQYGERIAGKVRSGYDIVTFPKRKPHSTARKPTFTDYDKTRVDSLADWFENRTANSMDIATTAGLHAAEISNVHPSTSVRVPADSTSVLTRYCPSVTNSCVISDSHEDHERPVHVERLINDIDSSETTETIVAKMQKLFLISCCYGLSTSDTRNILSLEKSPAWLEMCSSEVPVTRLSNIYCARRCHLFCRIMDIVFLKGSSGGILRVEDGTVLAVPCREATAYERKTGTLSVTETHTYVENLLHADIFMTQEVLENKRIELNVISLLFNIDIRQDEPGLFSFHLCRSTSDIILLDEDNPMSDFLKRSTTLDTGRFNSSMMAMSSSSCQPVLSQMSVSVSNTQKQPGNLPPALSCQVQEYTRTSELDLESVSANSNSASSLHVNVSQCSSPLLPEEHRSAQDASSVQWSANNTNCSMDLESLVQQSEVPPTLETISSCMKLCSTAQHLIASSEYDLVVTHDTPGFLTEIKRSSYTPILTVARACVHETMVPFRLIAEVVGICPSYESVELDLVEGVCNTCEAEPLEFSPSMLCPMCKSDDLQLCYKLHFYVTDISDSIILKLTLQREDADLFFGIPACQWHEEDSQSSVIKKLRKLSDAMNSSKSLVMEFMVLKTADAYLIVNTVFRDQNLK